MAMVEIKLKHNSDSNEITDKEKGENQNFSGNNAQTFANLMKALSHSTIFPIASLVSSIMLLTG